LPLSTRACEPPTSRSASSLSVAVGVMMSMRARIAHAAFVA
jgi:hypothetical protein